MPETGYLELRLNGRFRVTRADGTDCTPRSVKAQALLALLMTAPDRERGRAWLQDKLWSDRDQPQGAASLRQALSEIRRAFGSEREVLRANRSSVALDPARVRLAAGEGEFLEGIDVRDPEFEYWLVAQRMSDEGPTPEASVPYRGPGRQAPPARRSILFVTGSVADPALRLAQELFVDTTVRTIGETLPVDLLRTPPANSPRGLLMVTVEAFHAAEGALGLRVCLEASEGHRILWSEIQATPVRGAPDVSDPRVLGLSNRLVDAVTEAVCEQAPQHAGDTDAARLSLLAVEKIFSLQPSELEAAEGLLLDALALEQRGLFHGWLAQLYLMQYVERFRGWDEVVDKAEEACARALELEPLNSNVLATVSNARLVLWKDLAVSGELARMGVDANPANPLARWSLASAQLYYGRTEEAYSTARRAMHMAAGSRYRFWSDFQTALTAAVMGRPLEAVQLSEAASALRPGYRPPLRYLIALYAGNGMASKAVSAAAKLTKIEPDFTVQRMVADPEYPISLMRNTGLLAADDLRELSA